MQILGYGLALLEIFSFYVISDTLKYYPTLKKLNPIVYYWTTFTILTGIWEFYFISNYKSVLPKAQYLIDNKEHVWTNKYSLSDLLPNKFSQLFYAEYGAYADREYMLQGDDWSRVIEGSHCLMCGLFCLGAILYKLGDNITEYTIFLSIGMGSQLMNSILYLVNYFHQTRDSNNINYITQDFPCGPYLQHRLFMYVNLLWTLMPLYVIVSLIMEYNYEKELIRKAKILYEKVLDEKQEMTIRLN